LILRPNYEKFSERIVGGLSFIVCYYHSQEANLEAEFQSQQSRGHTKYIRANIMAFFMLPLQYEVVILLFLICIVLSVHLRFFYVDFGQIKGLLEVPGGSWISGHLYMLGNDHASNAGSWARTNSWPVYQIRLGNRRAIMLNSFFFCSGMDCQLPDGDHRSSMVIYVPWSCFENFW
jgi:hypothetical protein